MIIFLLFLSASSFALTKAQFFPMYPVSGIIEERIIGKRELERSLERKGDTYHYSVNWKKLDTKMTFEVANPIHQLGQYSICSMYESAPLQVSIHYEPYWIDTYFKCVVPPNYDPVKFRDDLKNKFCTDLTIRSEAQNIICKELMLK